MFAEMGKVATDWGEGWNKVLDPTGKRIIKAQCDYCKRCLSNIGLNARIKHRYINFDQTFKLTGIEF